MLKAIREFFDSRMQPAGAPTDAEHAVRLATAALLVEMTRQDEAVHAVEREAVVAAVCRKFELSADEAETLVGLAEAELRESTDYHQFTSLINKGFTPEQKVKVIELLWRVAYADGRLDPYEEHMVRKIADLIYVPHAAFIAAKHRVVGGLGRQP